jgi:O-antigen ligase
MTRKLDIIIAWTLVVAIVFSGLAHGAVEPWSIAAVELLIILMLELWALRAVAQRRLNIMIPSSVYPLVGLLLLGIIQAISWTAADGSRASLSFDVDSTRSTIFLFALMIIAMLVAANFWTSRSRLKAFAVFLTVFGFAFAVFAIIQGLTWNGRFYWVRIVQYFTAPYGPFPSHNNYAGYLELFIPIPIAIALSRAVSRPTRLFAAFAGAIMSLSVIFSLSRGGMISLAAGLLFLGVAALQGARHRRRVWEAELSEEEREELDEEVVPMWRRAPYPQAAMAIAIVLAIIVGMIWLGPDKIASRLTQGSLSGEEGKETFYGSRGWIWSDTWRMIKANPLSGVGLGAYGTAFPIYTVSDGSIRVKQVHNDYLQILADGGVIGGLLAIWFLATVFRAVFQGLMSRDPWHGIFALGAGAAIFSLLVHSLFDFNLQIPSTGLLFLVLVGIVGGTAEVRRRRELESRTQRRADARRLATKEREPRKVAAALFSGSRFEVPLLYRGLK